MWSPWHQYYYHIMDNVYVVLACEQCAIYHHPPPPPLPRLPIVRLLSWKDILDHICSSNLDAVPNLDATLVV